MGFNEDNEVPTLLMRQAFHRSGRLLIADTPDETLLDFDNKIEI